MIGWPDTKYSTAAQAPSTRKIGMPAASRPKNSTRKPMAAIARGRLIRATASWSVKASSAPTSCASTIVWPTDIVCGSKKKA